MPEQTEYAAEKGIVIITYAGKVTIGEVKEATVKAIAIQKDKHTNRVLIDAADMTAAPSISEMWALVQSYPELEVPRQTRLAAIRPKVPDKADVTGFFEVVCQNRCYNAKGFSTREAAEEWVRSDRRA
jgi:SpoIIAA-like